MPRYMIEASHQPSMAECLRILDAFIDAGSHYLTHAEWGCLDGDHRAWVMVEANDDVSARLMVPPVIRRDAKVVRPYQFTPEQIHLIRKLTPKQRLQLRKLTLEQLLELLNLTVQQVEERLSDANP